MKLLKHCCVTLMLLLSLNAFAQNYMDIMNTFEGPWGNSEYGKWMATLDFNADGVDDLFVLAREEVGHSGEVHVFWGGNNFGYNNSPDYIITLTDNSPGYDIFPSYGVFACGDVNGDGYDDLAICAYLLFDYPVPDYFYYRFFHGGPDAELDFTEYDHEYGFLVGAGYYYSHDSFTSCLGDVNGDGCDDMGFILDRGWPYGRELALMLGGTFEMIIVESDIVSTHFNIEPMGDLNSDGYDDFSVGYMIESDNNNNYHNYTKVYYGNPDFSLNNNEIMFYYQEIVTFNGAITIGDFNGDGHPDFLYPRPDNGQFGYLGLALIGEGIEDSMFYPIQCDPNHSTFIYAGVGMGSRIKHGDFNGDGYSDFVGSNTDYGLWSGTAGVWLGGENPNAIFDLQLEYHDYRKLFGWNINVGDYNNDGYDDIAISAPYDETLQYPDYQGKVYIYAGNPNLTDTTVSNEDNDVLPQPCTNLIIYPNPVSSKELKLNLKLVGHLPKNIENAMVSVYNLKGQKVHERKLNPSNIKNSCDAIKLESLASGLYIATIKINNKRLATSKFIVK